MAEEIDIQKPIRELQKKFEDNPVPGWTTRIREVKPGPPRTGPPKTIEDVHRELQADPELKKQ